jgi:hypothetical protein
MTRREFIQRQGAYRRRAALAALVALGLILLGVGPVLRSANGAKLLFLLAGCILIPLLVYAGFAFWLAGRMGVICSSCGRRLIVPSVAFASGGKCPYCGGACVDVLD